MTDTPTAPASTVNWGRSLEASVDALASAADRIHRALQQAVLLRDGAEYTRVTVQNGAAIAAASDGSMRHLLDPDGAAVGRVLDAYRDLTEQLETRYTDAAWALAHGAHWALTEVLAGRTPDKAQITYSTLNGEPVGPVITRLEGLPNNGAEIEAARQNLDRHLAAGQIAEDIGRQRYIADHEAGEMHDALDVARGTAAAAHAYGLACQKWLPLTIHLAKQARAAAARAEGADQ